jgi:hypothetical protein
VAATAVAVAVSGCGGGASATLDPVAKAADLTTKAGGARVHFGATVTIQGLSAPLSMTGDGDFNFKADEGNLAFTMSGLPSEVVSRLNSSSLKMTELYKSNVAYVSSPLFASTLPDGDHWLKLDYGHVLQAEGLDPSSIANGTSNPAQYLQYLTSRGANLSTAGHETVRGVSTTRYTGTINLLEAAEHQPGANAAQVRKTFGQVLSNPADRIAPLSVWIDGHDLVRKMTMDIKVEPEGHPSETNLVVEYFEFGSTPSVTVPPASEVLDATSDALQHLGG